MDEERADFSRKREEFASRGKNARDLPALLRAFFVERYLSLDVRWLGIFRWALGGLLIVELLRRWYYARPFYTNDGLLPNHFSLYAPMGRNVFSIYHAFSSLGEVNVAFFLTLVVFTAFTLGYRTKLFHLLSAVCITSLNARDLFVENGGTVVVNILTVYTLFLPLGERFSLDAVRRSLARKVDASVVDLNRPDPLRNEGRAVSFAVLLLLVQWSAIYFFNTVQKDGAGWRNGSALYWFYHQNRIVTVFGIWVREHVPFAVLRVLTYGALVTEGSLSVLILFPFFQRYTRRIVLALVWCLHGIIALSARIGPFSYAMMLFPVLLLGADDFDWLTRSFRSEGRARRVVIDAESAWAFGLSRLLARIDPFGRLTFVDRREASLLPAGLPAAPLLVLDGGGRVFEGADAFRELTRALPFGVALRGLLHLPGVGAAFERRAGQVAKRHRAWARFFGWSRRPKDPHGATATAVRPLSSLREGVDALLGSGRELAVFVLGVAVVSALLVQNPFVANRVKIHRSELMTEIIEYPRLLQGWSMFAPEPPYEDGRLVVDGRTADGRAFDPFSGGRPDFAPDTRVGWDHSQFWCDYHNRIRYPDNRHHLQHLREYLLRQHEFSGHPRDALVAFDVWWVHGRSPEPGQVAGTPLLPEKLLSYGQVNDSGATGWSGPLQAGADRKTHDAPLRGP
jgi:hypothetical protein